jgi:hypothetical protein
MWGIVARVSRKTEPLFKRSGIDLGCDPEGTSDYIL